MSVTSVTSAQGGAVQDPWPFCHQILPDVSRTFALTIPVLPRRLADSVCCAYLICRIADTVEDRPDVTEPQRRHLFKLLERLLDEPADAQALAAFDDAWPDDPASPYQTLMRGTRTVMTAYGTLPASHRAAVADCAREMMQGMGQMIHRPAVDGVVYVCADLPELERYCHFVAGTVGLMLTRLFDAHLGAGNGFSAPERAEEGRRFGLALQLTNILKDHVTDVERGVSFLAREWLAAGEKAGPLSPAHLAELVRHTLGHLDTAEAYTLALPASSDGTGMRLFCLWAFWMAAATLREVARARDAVPKIDRNEVAEIIEYTKAHVLDDAALRRRYDRYRQEALAAAEAAGGAVGGVSLGR